jgi:hypothetical protein
MNVHRNPSAFEAHEAPTLLGRSQWKALHR